jgi:hypothetical protein
VKTNAWLQGFGALMSLAQGQLSAPFETAKVMDSPEGTMDQSTFDQLSKERLSNKTASLKSQLWQWAGSNNKQPLSKVLPPTLLTMLLQKQPSRHDGTMRLCHKTNHKSTVKQSISKPSKSTGKRPGNRSATAATATSNVSTKQKKGKRMGSRKSHTQAREHQSPLLS